MDAVGDPHHFLSPVMCLSGFVASSGCPLDTVLVRLESHDYRVASARLWLKLHSQDCLLAAVGMAISDVVCPLSGDSTTEPASGSDDGQVSTLPRFGHEVSSGVDFVALDYVALATNYAVNWAVERSAAVLRAALLAAAAHRLVHSLQVSAVCRLQSLLSAAGARRFVQDRIWALEPDGADIPLSAVGGSWHHADFLFSVSWAPCLLFRVLS